MALALEGIKVLDFSRLLPGPFASWVLGDFGADVLRVEEPGFGSTLTGRRGEQAKGAVIRGVLSSADPSVVRPWDAVGRNKKSICLNLKHPRGQEIARRLAREADVLLEEFRPGVSKRLGMDYETISEINPGIIYCSVTLYGQNGPYKDYPGHDPCALGVAGVLSMCGDLDQTPRFVGLPIDDISSGLHAIIGILLALQARHQTGRGQQVDISMTDAAMDFQASVSRSVLQGKTVPRIDRPNPAGGVWKCKDGQWIVTTNVEPHHWANFCRTIGREDLIPHQYNRERRDELFHMVQDLFLTKTRQEWLDIFWKGPIESQASPANRLEEVFDDPQMQARNMVWELDHPQLGKVRQQGASIKLSNTPAQFRHFAAVPGEQTDETLAGLGYSPEDIEALKDEGAVG
jgi:crotonobetainyl-CoA:carnitine CoA-transferase CaiB-like acyl-CoA transferase